MTRAHPLLLALLLPGCPGGGDTADTADTGGEAVEIDPAVIVLLADRLAEVQNDDGSYDWERGVDEALTPEETGYQNVTGVTALGFYGALSYGADADWYAALDGSAAYFDLRLDDLLADPTDLEVSISSANWTFLARYQDYAPDAALDARTIDGLNALLDARDAAYGDDDTRRVDGLMNYLVDRRASIPGIIPWDAAHWVEALDAMAVRSDDFADDAEDAAAWLHDYTQDTFLPVYDADPTYAYADISLAWPLYVLAGRPETDDEPSLTLALQERLEALVSAEGEVSNGSDDDGPVQCTAYALLAFKAVGSDQAQLVQDYGEAQVTSDGMVINDETAVENYEIEGELLRALAE